MDDRAPYPTAETLKPESDIKIVIVGCGGAGINNTRAFKDSQAAPVVKFFDTSLGNQRQGEEVIIVAGGSGSGSNRASNARDIESAIPQLDAAFEDEPDVAILVFSAAGGSGSVLGPILSREYARRKVTPIAVVIVDSSSAIGAKNTINTLKTLTAIANNAKIGLPIIFLSNDEGTRSAVDITAKNHISAIIKILTRKVYEVDKADRINWIDPYKLVGGTPGLKIMSFTSTQDLGHHNVLIGADSTEMVDSLLVLEFPGKDGATKEETNLPLPSSRLKKTGMFVEEGSTLIGKVSSDISDVNKIIDNTEAMASLTKAQKHETVDRLGGDGDTEIFL